jgi:hypothetical protein
LTIDTHRLHELLGQTLETELAVLRVYEAALPCARHDELREEWERDRDQTARHVELVEASIQSFGLDPDAETTGRRVVRRLSEALTAAIVQSRSEGTDAEAEVVAAECVVLAETKSHLLWDLIGEAVTQVHGEAAEILVAAHSEVEDEEDEHVSHGTGWARELWTDTLGLPAVLPPPEERTHPVAAVGGARAYPG